MLNPVRATAGWLAGRMLVFLAILAALVAWDAYRDESKLLGAMLKGLVPDKEFVERLETARADIENFARETAKRVNQRLTDAQKESTAAMDTRIAQLQEEIAAKERQRRSQAEKMLAMLSGKGFEQDLKLEIEIQLLTAGRDALKRIRGEINTRRIRIISLEQMVKEVAERTRRVCDQYNAARDARDAYEASNSILSRVPLTPAKRRLEELQEQGDQLMQSCIRGGQELEAAQTAVKKAQELQQSITEQVQAATGSILGPLDELVSRRREALDSARQQAEKIQQSIRKVFLNALGILILVTVAPVGIKAVWYRFIARLAERQRPVRLRPGATGMHVAEMTGGIGTSKAKISAVSQEIVLGDREELLVHPEFLQSSSDRGRKQTKWLLNWRYWFTSIAANMVALDRIRAAGGEFFVVSSKNDAFAEVGLIALPEGSAFVLQPRNLVGVVQSIDRPIRITRKWNWSLMAFITLQFRYLIFEGPGKLVVQGCRGVRVEQAGTGRSIDQAETIGFSANLDYSPKRSETFGAYLLGTRGLFNDRFSGGPGVYVCQEMPYWGKKSGITGRGLEGLTDGLLKVVGI